VNPSSKIFRAVSKLVSETWRQDLVGHGQDAKGLAHRGIRVKQVSHIENAVLFKRYEHKKQEICLSRRDMNVLPIKGLAGEREIATLEIGNFILKISFYLLLILIEND